jgi:hypothetical protein
MGLKIMVLAAGFGAGFIFGISYGMSQIDESYRAKTDEANKNYLELVACEQSRLKEYICADCKCTYVGKEEKISL